MQKVLKKYFYIFFWFPLITTLIFFHFRGVIYYDEGYILNSALRTLHGEVIYKNFDFAYTPLSPLFIAIFLGLFGESVFSGRLAALIISLLSLFALYKILKLLTQRFIFIFLSLLFFIAWGPTHINFPWPTMFAVCFYLFTLLFIMLGFTKKKRKYFAWAGVMTILVLASKQNFGASAILATSISFFLFNLSKKKIFISHYLLGLGSMSAVILLIVVVTDSLLPFSHNIDMYTVKRILVGKVLDTPFIYEGTILQKIGKLLFYLSPALISLLAFFTVYSIKKKVLGIIPIFIITFYLLGVRPTTDYTHTVPLLALATLSFAMSIVCAKNMLLQKGLLVVMILVAGFGFYRANYSGYYKWDWALSHNTYFSNHPRLHVFLTEQKAKESEKLIAYIQQHTKNDDYIFVNYYSPLIYLLTDRKNPTPYDLFSPIDLPRPEQEKALQKIKDKNTKLFIMNIINKDETSIVANYIKKNFRYSYQVADWVIYTKK